MKVYDQDDTVAAIATPKGEGGIGIIRISGPLSFQIFLKIFKPKKKQKTYRSHRLYFGEILDPQNNTSIDEALFSYMKAPNSYTREDVVEINCHGGSVVLQKTMELLMKEGAREAEPGEFTKRAFLNGRIDLSQAEAVIDLIRSKTEAGLNMAVNHLKGALKVELDSLREHLTYCLALIETRIDFPEEDIEPASMSEIKGRLSSASMELEGLIKTYDEGRILRDGIHVVIAGVPNVGKSSLMNALLRETRVIVTSVPGTTRDTIEEVVNIKGIPVNLIDTAGIRDTDDIVEGEGIKKTMMKLNNSDMVLYMLDERGLQKKDLEILMGAEGKKTIIILNKMDLLNEKGIESIRCALRESQAVGRHKTSKQLTDIQKDLPPNASLGYLKSLPFIPISASSGTGVDQLKELIHSALISKELEAAGSLVISRKRHKVAMERALDSIHRAINGMDSALSPEFISADINDALGQIGEIAGETTPEQVLDVIFNEFCIGK